MTSIGATVAACSHENQPNEAPTAPPNAKCGKRAVPPATGYMAPSSACMRASSMIATPPMTHEMIAAGPAVWSAPCAPNSQPEPMIEPVDAHSSPMKPISRLRLPARRGRGAAPMVVAISPQPERRSAIEGGPQPRVGGVLGSC